MNVDEARRLRLSLVGNQEQGRHGLESIQVQHQMIERVAVPFFGAQELCSDRPITGWQIAEQTPQFFATPLLASHEVNSRFRFGGVSLHGLYESQAPSGGAPLQKVTASGASHDLQTPATLRFSRLPRSFDQRFEPRLFLFPASGRYNTMEPPARRAKVRCGHPVGFDRFRTSTNEHDGIAGSTAAGR